MWLGYRESNKKSDNANYLDIRPHHRSKYFRREISMGSEEWEAWRTLVTIINSKKQIKDN